MDLSEGPSAVKILPMKRCGWAPVVLPVICLAFVGAALRGFSQDPCNFMVRPPALKSNEFRFSFTGESEAVYSIETSTNLQNWVPIATNLAGGFNRTVNL